MKPLSYSAYIILDERRAKSDGTYPLKLRVIVNRKSFHIPLKISVLRKHWKADKGMISTSCKTLANVTRENVRLQKIRSKALNVISSLLSEQKLESMSVGEIKAVITGEDAKCNQFFAYCDNLIAELKGAGRIGTAGTHKTLRNSVYGFHMRNKKANIPLQGGQLNGRKKHPLENKDHLIMVDFLLIKITTRWLHEYETWYLGKGNGINGLGVNLRTLRSLINKARGRGDISKTHNPFEDYTIKKEQTKKRAIRESSIQLLQNASPQTEMEQRSKDYFLMSYYLMGANFIDLMYLRKSNINNGRIVYRRQKTRKLYNIKIRPELHELLEKYLSGKETDTDPYILNIVKESIAPNTVYNMIKNERKRYNKAIKRLAHALGIEKEITSYVARHSYATIAKYKGMPTAIISDALGHNNESTTQIYLNSFEHDVLDAWNDKVIG